MLEVVMPEVVVVPELGRWSWSMMPKLGVM